MYGRGQGMKSFLFGLFWGILFLSATEVAANNRCPVCHESFESDVHVCPNDGTNLDLLGEPVKPSDAQEPTWKNEKAPKDTRFDASDTANPTEDGKHKYIRHDRGGRRRRVTTPDSDTGVEDRTDRQRRLHDARTGVAPSKRKTETVDPNLEIDAAMREKYRVEKEKASLPDQPEQRTVIVVDKESQRQRELWKQTAPLMSIGGRVSWMGESDDPGPVQGVEIDLNLLRTNVRVGLSSFIGVRHVSRNELLFLESVSIGVQKPWRFSPYFAGRIGIGTIVSQRFGADITNLVRAVGVDAGIDCRLNNAFVVTPSVGYVRYGVDAASWDSVTLKISLGF